MDETDKDPVHGLTQINKHQVLYIIALEGNEATTIGML